MVLNRVCVFFLVSMALAATACCGGVSRAETDPDRVIEEHCAEIIGPPRVERISEHVWAAIGYDLASVVLIKTEEGAAIVDTAMSPSRAREIKEALEAEAGPFSADLIIYTHSHIDHVGGASVFRDENTQIWSTEALGEHFFKQYGRFLQIEGIRGGRQFGTHVPDDILPCSALGRRVDIELALENGVLYPTHTFSGRQKLDAGGLRIDLIEAHGETHDQLFVWIPEDETLVAGDNFYWSFPNIYTLRGTSPRPVDEWIDSVDRMRSFAPEHLMPNHAKPIHGKKEIAETLTSYRDAIQWVRDEVVRGANRGEDLATLAESIELPPRLADLRYNLELYGRVDWAVKAIFTNNLGWFDGRAEELYPMERKERCAREIEMMGGRGAVLDAAVEAFDSGDYRWSVNLLSKLRYAGIDDPALRQKTDDYTARNYEHIAGQTYNTNGRAYLLEAAHEIRHGLETPATPKLTPELADKIPLEHIFDIMQIRIDPERAAGKAMVFHFLFPDIRERYVLTLRGGIVEIVKGEPLPFTPEPDAKLNVGSLDFKLMSLGVAKPMELYSSGRLKVKGNMGALTEFLGMFDR